MTRVVRLFFACSLQLLLITSLAAAQGVAVTGRVVDPQGALVAGADVLLTAGAATRSTRSSADGTFAFAAVQAGAYELLVIAPGFANRTQAVTVGGTPAMLTVTLALAGITEDITVQGAMTGGVTTGKTNMPLRDIPMTVHSVPSIVLREQAVNDLVGALQNVTGVNPFTQYGIYEGYTFRGFLDLFPPTAGQLIDGVRNESTNRINTQLTNIERIEVLKGPSSALYGGGALGATVNLIRKKPSLQPGYDFSASAGSWNTGRGTFGATGRLGSDAVLYRLDVGAESKEGYRHNDTTRVSMTPSLAWRLGANNQVNVYYTFNRDRFAGDAGIPLLNTDFGGALPASVFPNVPRDRNFRSPQDQALSFDNNLQITYARQFNNSLGFRNTLSYRHLNDEYFIVEFLAVEPPSAVYREFLQFKHHRRPLTNLAEFTARVTRGIEQNIVAGWEGQRYKNHTDTIPGGGVAEATYIDLFNPVETQGTIAPPIARIRAFNDKNNAFYFQDHLTLGAKTKALVGGRFDIYRHHRFDTLIRNGVETPGAQRRRETEAFTGRLGIVHQPVPKVDLYASYATSYLPLNDAQPDGSTLEPLTGRQVEFGQRFHMAGGRVDLNTSVYHQVRKNIAFSRPGGVFNQASEVTSKGFEADIETRPVSNWRVNGGYAFTHAEFGDYLVNATTNLKGKTPVFAPRHTFNLWTAYDWPSGLGVNVGLRAVSSQFGERANVFKLDGYGLVNAAVRYTRGPIEYALNIYNLTDTEYFASTLYDTQMYPGEPINVLGTIRVRLR